MQLNSARPLTAHRRMVVLCVLLLLVFMCGVLSLCVGSTAYRPWQLLQHHADAQIARDVVFNLRLPRTLTALAVGGLLAVAGALQQILLRNPLADPYILGTSGGASVGALLAMLLGVSMVGVNLSAAFGSLLAMLLVFGLGGRRAHAAHLLLVGVAVSAFCGAFSSLLLSVAPDGLLRGMIFWMLGDLSGATWGLAASGLVLVMLVIWPFLRDLNILALGQQRAHALGISTEQLSYLLYGLAAISTAIAVTTAGMIGFVGLIVPHALRLCVGQDHRLLIPACALVGGMVLLLADILSRVMIAPEQLPVGVVTALCGAPLFIWLLSTRQGSLR
jgi:iron complex transport system permease protein